MELLQCNVIFESDSQRVIQVIQSNTSDFSEFRLIIQSIQILFLFYPNFEVKFIKRQTNMVVHFLAKTIDS